VFIKTTDNKFNIWHFGLEAFSSAEPATFLIRVEKTLSK
jgi:hypothetical protein